MNIKSWYEERREVHNPEELAATNAAAKVTEAEWRANGCQPKTIEDDIMRDYAFGCMGDELFALGDFIIQQHPDPEDDWWLADCVYIFYADYYMMVNRPADAVGWFLKAFENNMTCPFFEYLDLAAAYIESGDFEQADVWIGRYAEYGRTLERGVSFDDWMHIAKYYHETDRQERAMAYMMELSDEKYFKGRDYYPLLGRIYLKMNELDKALDMFQTHQLKFPKEGEVYSELAITYYFKGDLPNAEANYLLAIELADKKWENYHEWVSGQHRSLYIVHANHAQWDKCFQYMKAYFLFKYEPEIAEKLVEMVDNLIGNENVEMNGELFQVIMAAEATIVGLMQEAPETVELPVNPRDEVMDASKNEIDMTDLLHLGNDLSN